MIDLPGQVSTRMDRFHAASRAIHVYGSDFFATERGEWNPENLLEGRYDVEKNMRRFEESNSLHG